MHSAQKSMLSKWLATEQGRYVLDWELQQFDLAVEDVFGFKAAQSGLPDIDFLRSNRIPHRFTFAPEHGAALHADPQQLPLANASVDLLALPHVLEFSADPHRVLREAERVLMPEGQVVISGFNPLSLWGARHSLMRDARRRDAACPWNAHFIGLLRLKDWLKLLGFELNGGMFGCYAPPFAQAKWLARFAFIEKAGARWWPITGGLYVVRAIKRVHAMRVVMPAWPRERAKSSVLSPVANSNGHARTRTGTDG